MKKSIMIIYIFVFFILALTSVKAYASVDIVSNVTKASSISYIDNYYYLTCIDCSGNGINNGIARYRESTDTYSDFSSLSIGGNIPVDSVIAEKGVNFYDFYPTRIGGGGSSFVYARQEYTAFSSTDINTALIYKYSFATNKWSLISNATDYSGGQTQFYGFNFLGSAYKGYNYNIIQVHSIGNIPYWLSYNSLNGSVNLFYNSIDYLTQYPNRPIFKNTDVNTNTQVYGRSGRVSFSGFAVAYTDIHFVSMPEYRAGWTNADNDIFIMVQDNAILYSTNPNNLSVNYNSNTLLGCSDIASLTNLQYNDIACATENDCVIVGDYGTTNKQPILIQYSKTNGCNYIDLSESSGYGIPINSSIYSVTYNPDSNDFGFVGNNIHGYVTTIPFENSTYTENPICIDKNTLCNNPVYVESGGIYNDLYCSPDDYEYCALDCATQLIDTTNNYSSVRVYSSCSNWLVNDEYEFNINCDSLTDRFINNVRALYSVLTGFDNTAFDYSQLCNGTTTYYPMDFGGCSVSSSAEYFLTHQNNDISSVSVCNNGANLNECFFSDVGYINILNYRRCISNSQFQICGQYDSDAYLELSPIYSCGAGEYCNQGYCSSLSTGTAIRTYPFITINPVSSSESTYESQTNTIKIFTDKLIYNQKFDIQKSNPSNIYLGVDCDYSESVLYNQKSNATINTGILDGVNIIEINTITNDGYVHVSDGVTEYNISIINNSVYEVYYNDVFIASTLNIPSVTILDNEPLGVTELKILSKSNLLNTNNSIFSTILSRSISNPITQITIDANISSIVIRKVSNNLPSLNSFSNNIQTPISCNYGVTKCGVSRFYSSNYNNGWINYKDVKYCYTLTQDGGVSTGDIPEYMKWIYALVVILVMFLFPIGIGYQFGMIRMGLITGVILAFFGMVAMSIPNTPFNFIPSWIIVVIVLLIMIISGVIISSKINGGQSG